MFNRKPATKPKPSPPPLSRRRQRATGRLLAVTVVSLLLWFFANQTQVGWLYVMLTMFIATAGAAWWYNRQVLNGLRAERQIGAGGAEATLHEGDDLAITLTLRNVARLTAPQVETTEVCPLAPPAAQHLPIFVPGLPGRGAVALTYDVVADRRGLFEFPPLAVESRAPFGFFSRSGLLDCPTRVLVYPEVRPLARLPLLDRRLAPEVSAARTGVGSEFIGIRDYRAGDSPRHIHWRTVARTMRLATKEFADETQPGLTLALDLFAHPYPNLATKNNPFEWAVKAAASIADYAIGQGYPLHLLADDTAYTLPAGALPKRMVWEVLARVQPVGAKPLASVLARRATQRYLAVVTPWPDAALIPALRDLQATGVRVLVVVIDPASFPGVSPASPGGPATSAFIGALQGNGVDEIRPVRFGDDWAAILGDRRGSGRLSPAASRPSPSRPRAAEPAFNTTTRHDRAGG